MTDIPEPDTNQRHRINIPLNWRDVTLEEALELKKQGYLVVVRSDLAMVADDS
jgi:hypothetical protein